MPVALDLKNDLIAAAGEKGCYDTRESWLARGARKLGITHRQAKAIFYGELKDPKASLAARIREAAEKLKQQKAETAAFEKANSNADLGQIVQHIKSLQDTVAGLQAQIAALQAQDREH